MQSKPNLFRGKVTKEDLQALNPGQKFEFDTSDHVCTVESHTQEKSLFVDANGDRRSIDSDVDVTPLTADTPVIKPEGFSFIPGRKER